MKRILLMITVLITLISCNQAHKQEIKDDPVVAEWRGGRITLSEYEEFALYYKFEEEYEIAAKSTHELRREVLYDMIKFRLINLVADSLRLDTLKNMQEARKRRIAAVSYRHHLFPDSVRRKVFPDSEILKVYEDMRNEHGYSIGSLERQRGRIINHLIEINRDKYEKYNSQFNSFLYKQYGVTIFKERIDLFVNQFNWLLNTKTNLNDASYVMDRNTVFATYSDKVITASDVINHFAYLAELDKVTLLESSHIDGYIFLTFFSELLYEAAVDLNYSTNPAVLKTVDEGMTIEYTYYLTDRFLPYPEAMTRWYNDLFNNYKLSTDHLAIERSFYGKSDVRK